MQFFALDLIDKMSYNIYSQKNLAIDSRERYIYHPNQNRPN